MILARKSLDILGKTWGRLKKTEENLRHIAIGSATETATGTAVPETLTSRWAVHGISNGSRMKLE